MKRLIGSVLCLLILIALSTVQFGFLSKKSAKIREFRVSLRQEGGVNIQFHLFRAFRADVRDKIESGGEVSFNYHIRLYRVRVLYPDYVRNRQHIKTTVQYDRLTKEYHLARSVDGEPDGSLVTTREDNMRRWMTNVSTIAFPEFTPKSHRDYYVKAKAVIQSDYAMAIIPWSFDTVWRRKELPHGP
jgi:hypothetical protein